MAAVESRNKYGDLCGPYHLGETVEQKQKTDNAKQGGVCLIIHFRRCRLRKRCTLRGAAVGRIVQSNAGEIDYEASISKRRAMAIIAGFLSLN